MHNQKELWDWAMPLLKTTFSSRIKTDTLPVWMSFLEVGRLGCTSLLVLTASSICSINETLVDIRLSSTTLCRSSTLLITTANRHSMPSKRCVFSGLSTKSKTGNSPGGWIRRLNACGPRYLASTTRHVPLIFHDSREWVTHLTITRSARTLASFLLLRVRSR